MADHTFVLPPELALDTSGGTLTLQYAGDVVLQHDLGLEQVEIEVSGDLLVQVPRVSGTLHAGGVLTIDGEVDGGNLKGAEILVGGGKIRCRAISASERIIIGAAHLQVDVIIAPEVEIDPKARGRVTVIESVNERGPTKIKGGFSLEEYESILGGDATQFLAERGIVPLSEDPPELELDTAAEEPAPAPVHFEDEDIDDPLSLSDEDLTPFETEQQVEDNDELYRALADAVLRITACYEGDDELPPPVAQLADLVASRDYPTLRQDITEVWNGLLGYHQQRGIRPHHQVTHAFNVIHGLLQPA